MKARVLFSSAAVLAMAAATALAAQPATSLTAHEVGACRAAVASRLRHEGYHHPNIRALNVDHAPDLDTITGRARAQGWYIPKHFSFTCSMDPQDGSTRSVQVGME
jgi:hypothetical protein